MLPIEISQLILEILKLKTTSNFFQLMSDISKQDCSHNKGIYQRTKMKIGIHHH